MSGGSSYFLGINKIITIRAILLIMAIVIVHVQCAFYTGPDWMNSAHRVFRTLPAHLQTGGPRPKFVLIAYCYIRYIYLF